MGICVSCRRRERKAPEKRSVPSAGGPAKGTAAAELLPRRVAHLPAMANSISNIKMTNPIKGIVSKRRIRYIKDGFNLDLACILFCVQCCYRVCIIRRDRCRAMGESCQSPVVPALGPADTCACQMPTVAGRISSSTTTSFDHQYSLSRALDL